MIPAKPNTYAIFTDTYKINFGSRGAEVVAWDDNGWAMVLPSNGKGLEAMSPWDIERIEVHEAAEYETYMQFIPVDDLYSLHYDKDNKTLFQKRLIGWAVTTGNNIVPVAEEEGDGMIAVSRDDDYVCSFRAADRDRVFADARERIEQAERLNAIRDANGERFRAREQGMTAHPAGRRVRAIPSSAIPKRSPRTATTADDADKSEKEKCAEFLLDYLSRSESLDAKREDIFKAARGALYSEGTIKRAKTFAGIGHSRTNEPQPKTVWHHPDSATPKRSLHPAPGADD